MLKDFYYSEKYKQSYQRNKQNDNENVFIREVLIDNKHIRFSEQVNVREKSSILWDDVIYVGSADNSNCKYTRIK